MSDQESPTPSRRSPGGRTSAALQVISADPTPVERWRRRRRILKSAIVTFVLIFSWIGIMVGVQMASSTAYNFRNETQLVLEQIRDGKAELLYREASPRLQETMIMDRFLELSSDIRRTLGGFREILAIKRVEAISGPGGQTARVQTTLEFDRGKTTASFSYHRDGDRWRLLGFDISIPPTLEQEVLASREKRIVRTQAPTEVFELVHQILSQVRDGKSGEVYDAASPTFQQSIGRKTFLEVQEQRRRALGKYVQILDTLEGTRNRSRSKAHVAAVVEYEKAKTTVTLGFIKIGDEWKLAHYKVLMPQVRVPSPANTAP